MEKIYKPIKPDKEILLSDEYYMLYEMLNEIRNIIRELKNSGKFG